MEVTDPIRQADILKNWRSGRIVMRNGRLVAIRRRGFLAAPASMIQVWCQTRFRSGEQDVCWLDYRSSRIGGLMVLDYVRSGPSTRLATFRGACQILDEVARLRQSVAIVAHVSTEAITDRLLVRWGWQRHAGNLKGRHWIKRFYDGYPSVDIPRYLDKPATAKQ